jgi:hypothetical protein
MAYSQQAHRQSPDMNPNNQYPSYEKNGVLSLYYNIAYDRLNAYLSSLRGQPADIRALVETPANNGQPQWALLEAGQAFSCFTDTEYSKLAYFLWKGQGQTGMRRIKPDDQYMVSELLYRLVRLRDYHSHYLHDNAALLLPERTAVFLREKHEAALAAVRYAELRKQEYYNFPKNNILQKETDELQSLTGEGVNFFLSFFLTAGDMNRFLDQRPFCSRTDNRFLVKRSLYLHYTHREASNIAAMMLSNNVFTEEDYKTAQLASLRNYLQSMPRFVWQKLSGLIRAENEDVLLRSPDGFAAFVANYLANFEVFPMWNWKVYTDEWEERGGSDVMAEGEDVVKKYLQRAYGYEQHLTPQQNLVLQNEAVQVRIADGDNMYYLVLSKMHLTELTTLLLVLNTPPAKIHNKLVDWCREYAAFMQHTLEAGSNPAITEQAYPLLHAYQQGDDGQAIPGIVPQAIHMGRYGQPGTEQVMAAITEKITALLQLLRHEKEGPGGLGSVGTRMRLQDDDTWQPPVKPGARRSKNQWIWQCIKWLGGRQQLITDVDKRKLADRFFYLLDAGNMEQYRYLLADMEHRLEAIRPCYEQAKSFDDFFIRIVSATIAHFENVLAHLPKQSPEQLDELARSIGVDAIKRRQLDGDMLAELRKTFCPRPGRFIVRLPRYFFRQMLWNSPFTMQQSVYRLLLAKVGKLDAAIYQPLAVLGTDETDIKVLTDRAMQAYEAVKDKGRAAVKAARQQMEAFNELGQHLAEDYLLGLIAEKYKPGSAVGLHLRYKKGEEALYPVPGTAIKISLQAADLQRNDSLIHGDRLAKMARYLAPDLGNEIPMGKIRHELQQYYTRSADFLSTLLALEQQVAERADETIANSRQLYGAALEHINFDRLLALVEQLGLGDGKTAALKQVRNTAFHTDILWGNKDFNKYGDAIAYIQKQFGIVPARPRADGRKSGNHNKKG